MAKGNYQRHQSPGYKDYILVPNDYVSMITHDGNNYYHKINNKWDVTQMESTICYFLSEYVSKYCRQQIINKVLIPIYRGPKKYTEDEINNMKQKCKSREELSQIRYKQPDDDPEIKELKGVPKNRAY